MECKQIDINTLIVDGIIYTAVEQLGCKGCDLKNSSGCLFASCGDCVRPDHCSVIWKRKTPDIQNESSSKHKKSINIEVVNENEIIVDGVKYQPITYAFGCRGCAFLGKICSKYREKIPCLRAERIDGHLVIWKKVSDKQNYVLSSKIKQTKTYKLNSNF